MSNLRKLTDTESIAIDLLKAISVLSVIAAHTVPVGDFSIYAKLVSWLWESFGRVGVVAFFMIGGFFYSRKENDGREFWKKKFFRLILPWLFCASATYALTFFLGADVSVNAYFRWILGSYTWYYYVVVYIFFLVIFKWIYQKEAVLLLLILVQIVALVLGVWNISVTLPIEFLTDYLNPLYWIGYFSMGILIRRHDLDVALQNSKTIPAVSLVILLVSLFAAFVCEVHTYFHILVFVYTICAVSLIAKGCYLFSRKKAAKAVRRIGQASYCIYLTHMQIVQGCAALIPLSNVKVTIVPLVGFVLMIVIVSTGSAICSKLPFGNKIKMLVGLL